MCSTCAAVTPAALIVAVEVGLICTERERLRESDRHTAAKRHSCQTRHTDKRREEKFDMEMKRRENTKGSNDRNKG